ncbi:MAG TPA: four helix bundle protein [Luteolibacter sp.]
MATNTFEDLEIWQLGCQLASDVSVATSCLGQDTLIDQMQHTADSIPSTIAAGANCRDTAGFIRFLRQSQEASAELRSQLNLSESIRQHHGQPPLDGFHVLIAETEELSKLIQNLIESLKRKRSAE